MKKIDIALLILAGVALISIVNYPELAETPICKITYAAIAGLSFGSGLSELIKKIKS